MTTSIAVGEMKQEAATQLESDKNTSMLSRAKPVFRQWQEQNPLIFEVYEPTKKPPRRFLTFS